MARKRKSTNGEPTLQGPNAMTKTTHNQTNMELKSFSQGMDDGDSHASMSGSENDEGTNEGESENEKSDCGSCDNGLEDEIMAESSGMCANGAVGVVGDDPSDAKEKLPADAYEVFDNMSQRSGNDKKAGFVSLFKGNRNFKDNSQSIRGFKAPRGFQMCEEDVINVKETWGYFLIGYVAGRFPGMKALIEHCKQWKVKFSVHVHASKWLVFKFDCDEDLQNVLHGGPYMIDGRPLFLKEIPSGFGFGNDELCKMPVWIQIPGMPLDCWSNSGIGKIVSQVGEPIAIDKLTATKQRMSYARAFVEVNASLPLVRDVEFKTVDGKDVKLNVVYEFEPKYCKKCGEIGHMEDGCNGLEDGFPRPQAPRRNNRPNPQPPRQNNNPIGAPQEARYGPNIAEQQAPLQQPRHVLKIRVGQGVTRQNTYLPRPPRGPICSTPRPNHKYLTYRRRQPKEKIMANMIKNTLFKSQEPQTEESEESEEEERLMGYRIDSDGIASENETEWIKVEPRKRRRGKHSSDDERGVTSRIMTRAKAQ